MGLDQYAFIRDPNVVAQPETTAEPADDLHVFYWRKHADLEGWMANLYYEKGGTDEFNCQEVELTLEDIDRLSNDHSALPTTSGFFFGTSRPEHIAETQNFISMAKDLLNQGHKLFYTSWW